MTKKIGNAAPLAALVLGLAGAVSAQPVLQQGNAQNPQNLQIGGPGGGPGGRGGGPGGQGGPGGGFGGPGGGQGGFGGPGGMQMTPEEMQQMMAQMQDNRLRRQLAAGNADQKTQDAIVQYSRTRDAGTQKIQDLMRQLVEAVSTKGTPDDKIAALLKQLEEATTAEKTRRKQASADLDAKVGYSKLPRLTAVLTTLGLIGDDSLLLNTSQGANMNMMGGRGGPGGGFGGPGGGFGGQGGPGGFGGGGRGGFGGGGPGGPPPGQ